MAVHITVQSYAKHKKHILKEMCYYLSTYLLSKIFPCTGYSTINDKILSLFFILLTYSNHLFALDSISYTPSECYHTDVIL